MRRHAGWLGLLGVLVLGVAFAAGNAGRIVTIDLGLITLYRVPVTFVAFGGMVVGMGVMLLAGINADLKVREILRRDEDTDVQRRDEEAAAEAHDDRGSTLADPSTRLDDLPDSWDRAKSAKELPFE